MMQDFSRQMDLFNPDNFNTPVHIIGAGATGSWVALFLAKLGINDITVWDFDTVGEHNLPNQLFGPDSVGCAKAPMVASIVSNLTGATGLKPKNAHVNGRTRLSGIVFMLTDTMKSRKGIWEGAIKMKTQVKLLVETRMGLSDGRIYTINPTNLDEIKAYEDTFYDDDAAEVSACGTSQSIITTAVTIAGMAVRQMINWVNEVDINHEILLDLQYNNVFTRRF